ncbi:protein kinase-like domain, concanavalin A-like lectin/glucanase domain protein [Tanacetum coccineum]
MQETSWPTRALLQSVMSKRRSSERKKSEARQNCKEDDEIKTDMKVEEVIKEEESEFETDEEVEEVFEEEDEDEDDESFNSFPTMKELSHHEWLLKHPRPPWVKAKVRAGSPNNIKISCMIGHIFKRHAYIDLESPINIMSRHQYNQIITYGLRSRQKPSKPDKISNFVGRVKRMKVFIGSFAYKCDFMILEDTSSIIDFRLGEMVFGKPFIDKTNLVYNEENGTVMFKQDEYKQDKGDRRGIRHLIRLEKEMMDNKGEVTYFSFGRHLDELHVTWAHLEKKRTRLRTNTKTLEDLCSQSLETASQAIHDAVITHQVTALHHFMTASVRTESNTDLEDSSYDGSIFSLCYLFRNPFSSTTIGDENPIRTLGDYSKPSHEGYRNTIELPEGNNVVPLRSDTIRLVQNGCSFHRLRSEDPNQHLKDFLKLVDSLDLDRSISTWEDLTTQFLAQFFPSGWTAKLRNDILMFQQHHGESLSEA